MIVACRLTRTLALLGSLSLSVASAQTDVITNGSFENGLTGWTAIRRGNATICGHNATTAAGTETLTGTPALPPSAGSQLAMVGIQIPSITFPGSCVLYQDVAIPADATTATLNLRWGVIRVGNANPTEGYAVARVYFSTDAVPGHEGSAGVVITPHQPASNDTALVAATSGSFDVSSVAGGTIRVILYTVHAPTIDFDRATVAGFDEVSLLVNRAPTVTAVQPASGPIAGSNQVTITGTDFTGATAVTFGGTDATSFTVINETTITAIVPTRDTAGAVSVEVTTPGGTNSANTLYQYFALVPTLSEWGMILLCGLLLFYGYRSLNRNRGLPGTPA